MDDRDVRHDGRIVEQVARLERVRPIDDDVVAGDDPLHVVGDEHLLVADHVDLRVERLDAPPGRVHFLLADPLGGVDDLALEVGQVDDIEVDDADRADPGRRQIEHRRRAEPARANEQDLGAEQLDLALQADLGDEQVAAVALLLLSREEHRRRPGQALCLPALEAAGHRDDIRVAERLEHLAGQQRADPAGAVQHDRSVPVGGSRLDLHFDVTLADVESVGQVALLPLGVLADVDDEGVAALAEEVRFGGTDLANLRASLAEEVGIGHWHGIRWLRERRAAADGDRANGVDERSRPQAGALHVQRRRGDVRHIRRALP